MTCSILWRSLPEACKSRSNRLLFRSFQAAPSHVQVCPPCFSPWMVFVFQSVRDHDSFLSSHPSIFSLIIDLTTLLVSQAEAPGVLILTLTCSEPCTRYGSTLPLSGIRFPPPSPVTSWPVQTCLAFLWMASQVPPASSLPSDLPSKEPQYFLQHIMTSERSKGSAAGWPRAKMSLSRWTLKDIISSSALVSSPIKWKWYTLHRTVLKKEK